MNVSRLLCNKIIEPLITKYGLIQVCLRTCTTATPNKLISQLQAKIKFNGPITVAEYMRVCLTHASEGYYINKDVFGEKGDFTTSPEISQMFGELVGVWFVNEWLQAGSPNKLQLVELGPGRGTMADDMLRAFSNFPKLKEAVSLHLVEVSEKLCEIQEQTLCGSTGKANLTSDDSFPYYKHGVTKHGTDVYWHRDVRQVPQGLTMFVAHEFFDALPIHKFQKADAKWSEVLVDIDPANSEKLRFVLAPADTPALVAYLKPMLSSEESRNHIEICPQLAVTVRYIANTISQNGGGALFVDYGHCGEKEDTFRGFKNHKLHDVLEEPGTADLTADVDFLYLLQQAGDLVQTFGPVTQAHFLQNMGIALRLKHYFRRNTVTANKFMHILGSTNTRLLFQKASPEEQKNLVSAFKMLLSPDQMGERFKFVALLNNNATHDPVGFDAIPASE